MLVLELCVRAVDVFVHKYVLQKYVCCYIDIWLYRRDGSAQGVVVLLKSVRVLLYVSIRIIQKTQVPQSIYFLILSVGWVPHFVLLLQVCQRGQIQVKEPTVQVREQLVRPRLSVA